MGDRAVFYYANVDKNTAHVTVVAFNQSCHWHSAIRTAISYSRPDASVLQLSGCVAAVWHKIGSQLAQRN